MLLDQTGISGMEYVLDERPLFSSTLFDKNSVFGRPPEPFSLNQLGLAFAVLAAGLVLSFVVWSVMEVNLTGKEAALAAIAVGKVWTRTGQAVRNIKKYWTTKG